MAITEAAYTPEEVVARGKALYEQGIRAQVEAGNVGRYLVIDVEIGDYELDIEHLDAARRAGQTPGRAALWDAHRLSDGGKDRLVAALAGRRLLLRA